MFYAVSGTDHGQLPLCGAAFPTEQDKPKRKKAIAAPKTAGNAAAAPGWHSGAVHADLPETLRLCALLPDAGCRSGSAASACREHGLRDASGSLFRVRSCFPHGLLGQHPLLCSIECTGAFCPDAGADDLPARNDPPAAVYRPGAASAAVAGHFHPAFAGTGGRSVQHAACPGHPDAAASAGLRCAASCGLQLCSLPADQSASAAGFSRNFPRKS